ncbi:MAG: vapC18 [Thermoleophilia bacterium]|nr:vapC18 [Thermoleophilia bacterium]
MITHVADTSAWVHRRAPGVSGRFARLVRAASVASCRPVEGELLYTSRDASEFRRLRESLGALPRIETSPQVWERAVDVWQFLADRGPLHHRQVGINDLVVAAAAESVGAIVLHYDSDFDVIASITGQPTEWIAPRGSL